mgnify:CR=1 FL=1
MRETIVDRCDENTVGFDVSSWVMGKEKKQKKQTRSLL